MVEKITKKAIGILILFSTFDKLAVNIKQPQVSVLVKLPRISARTDFDWISLIRSRGVLPS